MGHTVGGHQFPARCDRRAELADAQMGLGRSQRTVLSQHMKSPTTLIRRFFAAYAKRMNDALLPTPKIDTPGVIDSFADYFVEASPHGVNGGKNGVLLRLTIP